MMWKGEVAAQVKWNGQALCAARLPACPPAKAQINAIVWPQRRQQRSSGGQRTILNTKP